MSTVIGSARHDELGNYRNGKSGDQLQKFENDFNGEVSMQYLKDFIGSRKFYILRPKDNIHAKKLAEAMKTACNNIKIGYDQNNRLSIMTYGVDSKTPTECDCSSLDRACIKKAVGISVPNFTTANQVEILGATGLFKDPILYKAGVEVYEGDVFVTTVKGHTGIAVDGLKRTVAKQTYIYQGVDYSKVFDPVFYAEKNPDIKNALGDNPTVLFNHFILFGCNEKSRYGKTIATFNVEVYGSHNPDLVKAFGALDDHNKSNPYCNGLAYYKHYCQFGYKENRRAI